MKKIITSIMIIFISIACIMNYSYAAGEQLEATIEITPSANEVAAGDTITFTFVTKNIVNAESGKIFAIGGKMVYNTAFFEVDTTNGITLTEETGLFNSTNAVSEGGTNGTITLKVKSDATGSGTVEFSDLEASDGRLEDMETLGVATTENQSFTIAIADNSGNEGSGNEGSGNEGSGNEGSGNEGSGNEGSGNEGSGNEGSGNEGSGNEGSGNEGSGNEGSGNEGSGDETCEHTYGSYTDNKDGKHSATCSKCGEKHTEAHTYGKYADNKDGKHSATCSKCGEKHTEVHTYKNGVCSVCGAKDNTTADKNYDKAGINSMLAIGIVTILVAVVIYKKNQKYKDIK